MISLRSFAFLAVLLIGTPYVFVGQQPSSPTNSPSSKKKESEAERIKREQREMEIQNLVHSANTLPIEIAADLLFAVLDKNLITDPQKKRQIIEDIFRRAPESKEPIKKAFRQGVIDTRAGYLGYAFGQDLDSLSIQLRAIRMMLALDKARARTLFREIPDIRLRPLPCEDDLDYEISEYYKVLGAVVDQTFDREAILRREHVYFASSHIDLMDSPSQVLPMIELLRSVKVSAPEFGILLDSFTAALRRVGVSPRGFAFSVNHGLSNAIRSLSVSRIPQKNAEPAQLSRAYRQYLAKQLSAIQCADSLITGTQEKLDPQIVFANTLFDSPLTADDVKPEKVDKAAKKFEYWHTPKAAKLLRSVKELRFGKTNEPLSLEQRNKQEWQQELMEFLKQMDEWQPEDEETGSDYLHQRSVLYLSLIELVPPGPMLGLVLQDHALFLRDSRMQKESPAQWLYYLKMVLRTGKKLKGKERDDFMRTLNASGNHIFPLYLDLERLQPAPSANQ